MRAILQCGACSAIRVIYIYIYISVGCSRLQDGPKRTKCKHTSRMVHTEPPQTKQPKSLKNMLHLISSKMMAYSVTVSLNSKIVICVKSLVVCLMLYVMLYCLLYAWINCLWSKFSCNERQWGSPVQIVGTLKCQRLTSSLISASQKAGSYSLKTPFCLSHRTAHSTQTRWILFS